MRPQETQTADPYKDPHHHEILAKRKSGVYPHYVPGLAELLDE